MLVILVFYALRRQAHINGSADLYNQPSPRNGDARGTVGGHTEPVSLLIEVLILAVPQFLFETKMMGTLSERSRMRCLASMLSE